MAELPASSDLYKVTRGQIEHQNDSLNQRVIWLTIAQSFFFSGYAILVTGNPNAEPFKQMQHFMLYLFPIASILIVAISYIDILSALIYLSRLRHNYKSSFQKEDSKYPPVGGWPNLINMQYASPRIIPVLFLLIWGFILMKWH
jgi:hypothetical protein